MNHRCPHLRELEEWSYRGCGVSIPEVLRSHIEDCASCAEELHGIELVRDAARKLPVVEIGEQKASEIRFALMAAARDQKRPKQSGRRPPFVSESGASRSGGVYVRRWVPWVALAAAVVALAIGLRHEFLPGVLPIPASFAQVELASGAQGSQVSPGPHETFVLSEGRASFSVNKLHEGQTYRVVVGVDYVAVRGTVFSVEARSGRLQAVSVAEGVVVVSVAGDEVAALHAGEHWLRSERTAVQSRISSLSAQQSAESLVASPSESDGGALSPVAGGPSPSRHGGRRSPNGSGGATPASAADSVLEVGLPEKLTPEQRAAAKEYGDAEFQKAWGLLQTGNPRAAALAFDQLANDTRADRGRRADARFWAARSYFQSGATGTAEKRAQSVVQNAPASWHAPNAALLLAEIALAKGDSPAARRWLETARARGNSKVIERANLLEERLR